MPIFIILASASLLASWRLPTSEMLAPGDTTIVLKAVSGLQYDIVRFRVKPGATVKIVLINTDEMAHNVVFTKPGYREEIVNLALEMGSQGVARGYIPTSDKIMAAIPVLSPDEQQTVTFKVPKTPGIYPYVCTYPGHGAVMYGAMYATTDPMPSLDNDVHVPPSRRKDEGTSQANARNHPYPVTYPVMYRTFMPDCGPAGIAVGLTDSLSYCWDAGQCRLRYAWKGGFVNMQKTWGGKGQDRAELVGTVFYREPADFPFRLGSRDHIPKQDFRGYSVQEGYPVFKYTLDDVSVTETITPSVEKTGFDRTLTFENLKQPLWFVRDSVQMIDIAANKGRWEGNYLKLSPEEAKQFTMTITEKPNKSR